MRRWKELYPIIGNKLTRAYPHMVETLQELKGRGVRLGVLSNKFDAGVHDVINLYLPDIFDVMHGESEEIPRKPDPDRPAAHDCRVGFDARSDGVCGGLGYRCRGFAQCGRVFTRSCMGLPWCCGPAEGRCGCGDRGPAGAPSVRTGI